MSPRGGQKGFGTGTGPDDVTWSEDGGRHLTQAGELLLEAEAQVQRGLAASGDTVRLDAFACSRALSELAVAQFVHRGVVAIERLAASQERTAVATERLLAVEQMLLDADTRDKGPTT